MRHSSSSWLIQIGLVLGLWIADPPCYPTVRFAHELAAAALLKSATLAASFAAFAAITIGV